RDRHVGGDQSDDRSDRPGRCGRAAHGDPRLSLARGLPRGATGVVGAHRGKPWRRRNGSAAMGGAVSSPVENSLGENSSVENSLVENSLGENKPLTAATASALATAGLNPVAVTRIIANALAEDLGPEGLD